MNGLLYTRIAVRSEPLCALNCFGAGRIHFIKVRHGEIAGLGYDHVVWDSLANCVAKPTGPVRR
jgi:hypothetical protein